MKKLVMVGVLVFVVFLAGCAKKGEVSVVSGASLVIKSFAPESPIIGSGEPVEITLITQNVGDQIVKFIENPELQLPSDWGNIPDPTGTIKDFNLTPPNKAQGIEGEIGSTTWSFSSAPTPPVTELTYTPTVRVYYANVNSEGANVGTISYSEIKIASLPYWKSITPPGATEPTTKFGVIRTATTLGPILITPVAPTRYVATNNGGRTISDTKIQIEIRNAGNGRVYMPSSSKPTVATLDKLNISVRKGISDNDDITSTCSGVTKETDTSGKTLYSIKLAQGESKTITCTLLPANSELPTFKDIALNVTVRYNYFVDASTSITVQKIG